MKRLFGEAPAHRAVFSFPEVRWQFTKPNEVPLNMKETPTAPLFPVRTPKKKKKRLESPLKDYQLPPQSSSEKVLPTPPPPSEHTPTPSLEIHMGHTHGWTEFVCMCEQSPWRSQVIPRVKLQGPTDSGQNLPWRSTGLQTNRSGHYARLHHMRPGTDHSTTLSLSFIIY